MNTIHSERPAFSVLDPRLPMLAAKAALQLDRCRLARESTSSAETPDLGAVSELGSMLKSATATPCWGSSKGLFDPPSIEALSQAIGRYESDFTQSSERLMEGLKELVEKLTVENIAKCDESVLAAVRDFFVALSDLAATGQRSRYRTRPVSPFRK